MNNDLDEYDIICLVWIIGSDVGYLGYFFGLGSGICLGCGLVVSGVFG